MYRKSSIMEPVPTFLGGVPQAVAKLDCVPYATGCGAGAPHAFPAIFFTSQGNIVLNEHRIQFRVRYQETDAQGRVHHANYFTYFEMGRVEQLRAAGYDYRRLEEEGTLLVIHKVACEFLAPAAYDDVLTLVTRTKRVTAARVDHEYELSRGDTLLARASSTLACVGRDGKIRRMPEWMLPDC